MSADKTRGLKAVAAASLLALGLAGAASQAQAAATLIIINANAAGVGFNDTTPVTPVGGNTGTTLGEQRLIAFQHAANLWGATLTSTVPIYINAQFSALTCDATSAVLGSAANATSVRNFANAPRTNTWYPVALRNKYVGAEVTVGAAQINANFNVNLGAANCLAGSPFYLGLDGNEGAGVDLVATLLHEFGHGLGFSVNPTNASTGARSSSTPSIWEYFMLRNDTNKLWLDMTNAERAASSIALDKLVWSGTNVVSEVPNVLRLGSAGLLINGTAAGAAAGQYAVGEASFGTSVGAPRVYGEVMPVVDQASGLGLACDALSAANRLAVAGKVALVDRGTCNFTVKAKNVQDAGAIAMVVADNAAGSPPPGLGGSDTSITIPAVRITQADGVTIKTALQRRSRTKSGVWATLDSFGNQYAGADTAGRPMLYTPNPFVSGSSVSHWDVSLFPNQLMEPNINADLSHSVVPPKDLTFRLLQDIGW